MSEQNKASENRSGALLQLMLKKRNHSITMASAAAAIEPHANETLRHTLRVVLKRMIANDWIYPIEMERGKKNATLTEKENEILLTLTEKGKEIALMKPHGVVTKKEAEEFKVTEEMRIKNTPVRQPRVLGGAAACGPMIRAGAMDFSKWPSKGY